MSMQTRFILLNTSHAGNVGAVARAMKVMGFDDLVLVQPRWPDVLTRIEALERASGADDVLRQARIVQSWQEAVDGIEHLCATAMTPRDFGPSTVEPRTHFADLVRQQQGSAEQPPLRSLGLVFGSERYGMFNEEVYRCHACLSIPTSPDYGSLNLASAAQVLAYEWRQALGGFAVTEAPSVSEARRADAGQIEGMLAHWQQMLTEIGYLDPAAPKKLMPRLQQLFHRAGLHDEEIHILRGIARKMQQRLQDRKP